ncbi:MAG: T9SS type A sorting domain-containing protein, partial [Saprospiraceae bacterium]|nr:T9SS type A sorting domain-containing protein [Saprospiraceae bacterium]
LCTILPLNIQGRQACNAPLFTLTDSITTQSLRLNWTDFNDEVIGWELEYGVAGFSPNQVPTTGLLTLTDFTISGLEPGTSYDVYIRAVCTESDVSDWNGPFKVRTAIDNDNACFLNLPIRDNNCPRLEDFYTQVSGYDDMVLGEDIFIQSVDIIIEHDWPADLELFLTSPDGNRILLSQNRGIGLDHYGNPEDTMCVETLSFSDFACIPISEIGTDQLIGSYLSEDRIADIYQSGNVNGLWKLSTCDRALEDRGILKYMKINFAPVICNVPTDIVAREISDQSAVVEWVPPDNCRVAIINIVLAGDAPGTNIEIFTSCQGGRFNVTGLLPETAYDIYIRSDCNSSQSAFSCPASFVTACNSVTLSSGFDGLETCIESCNADCELDGPWINSKNDDQDWLIHSGTTATLNTGPEGDISGVGNYLYLENSIDLCGQRNNAILETTCIEIVDNPGPCDMSFYYHMLGEDVDSLILLISVDNGTSWDTLFASFGSQGTTWRRSFIDLEGYEGQYASMRFVGISGENDRADIGLDQIEFYGTQQVIDLPSFYFDNDNDGYGGLDSVISICLLDPPQGYYSVPQDCDDQNAEINPDATEIQCNLIDENCNGLEDDAASSNPILYEIEEIINESCPGASDASISITVIGGNPPYDIQWNDGQIGSSIVSLKEDVYRATITDAGTCTTLTEFIDIDVVSEPQIFIVDQNNSQCDASSGSIDIEIAGGSLPYTYNWNNGDTTQDLQLIPEGNYSVTVTDNNGCMVVRENINIISSPRFNAGIQFKKDLTCLGDSNGIITVGIFNAIPPVTYNWSNGDTTESINGLIDGIYSVTINDARGCEEIIETEINTPTPLDSEILSIEQVTCFNGSNGSIQVGTQGGVLPYNFQWMSEPALSFNLSKQEDISNLPPGNYQLSVSDANGCKDTTRMVTITNPDDIDIQVDSSRAVRCILSNDGFISVDVEGGAGDYNYFWASSDEDINFLTDISGGIYSLTVIDKFGCKKTVTDLIVNINDQPIDIVSTVIQDNLCSYDSLGMIRAEVTEGTLPLDFNWSSGKQIIVNTNVDTIRMLPGGQYNVTVTDSEGCVGISLLETINTANIIVVDDISIELNECNNDSLGTIDLSVSGGQPPFDYLWSTGDDSESIDSLANGEYYVTITDDNSCFLPFGPISITSRDPINIDADITYADGGMDNGSIKLTISGGSPPYQIDWENLEDQLEIQSDLSLGTYCLTITDSQGCMINGCFSVDRSNAVSELESQISIFPNPVEDLLTISTTLQIKTIAIYNVNGQIVKEFQTSSDPIQSIQMDDIESGIYFLHLITDRGIFTDKIVVIN